MPLNELLFSILQESTSETDEDNENVSFTSLNSSKKTFSSWKFIVLRRKASLSHRAELTVTFRAKTALSSLSLVCYLEIFFYYIHFTDISMFTMHLY